MGGDYRQNEMSYYDLLDSTIGVMSSLLGIVTSILYFVMYLHILLCIVFYTMM